MVIYLDIVLLENIILNYIILLSTSILSNSKTNFFKIVISSLIGGIFSILNYLVNINTIINFFLKIIISICMMQVTFKTKNIKGLIKNLIYFYLISFTFGGIAFMLIFLINPNNVIINKNHFIGTYPIKMAIIAGIVGFIIIFIVSKIIKFNITKKSMIYDLEIFYEGKYTKIKSMLDTGNLLKEPITNNDVIIIEKESLTEILGKDYLNNLSNIINGKWIGNNKNDLKNIKIIPFSSLGNDNGILIGFKPDLVKIIGDEEIVRKDIIIAIYDGKLTRNRVYTGLIGVDALKNKSKLIETC